MLEAFGDTFNDLLTVFLSILLPATGLTPLSMVMWFGIVLTLLGLTSRFVMGLIRRGKGERRLEYSPRLSENEDGEYEVEYTFESASAEVEELLQSGPMLQRHIRSGTSLGVDETWNTLQEMKRQGKVRQRLDGMWELR